jgi:hypothetical protein
MGRYVELARRTIETLHADVQSPAAAEDSSDQHLPYEVNERNERSLFATSSENASRRPIATIAAWVTGVARLRAMVPPRNYPEHAWQQLIADAGRFLDSWAAQAHRLGWADWELFGCHRRAPWGRVQAMGLVLLVRGDEIAALTATEAAIRTPTGVWQTYQRKPSDPLHPAERCLVWELDE